MTRLGYEMNANYAKQNVNVWERKEEIRNKNHSNQRIRQSQVNKEEAKTGKEELKAEKIARKKLLKEIIIAKLKENHKRMMSKMDPQLEETKACLEKEEATDLNANPEE
jgi:hypothetical protein